MNRVIRLRLVCALIGLLTTLCSLSFAATQEYYQVGFGKADITAAPVESTLLGYGQFSQYADGIHMRLKARAIVIEDPKNARRVALVVCDLGMIFESVKSGVIQKLQSRYGKIYDESNVVISATHTHSSLGGFAFKTLYNLTPQGFNQENYDVIVHGIVQAIVMAHENRQGSHIYIGQTDLEQANFNRSPSAYLKNPKVERNHYRHNTDTQMTLVKFENNKNQILGSLNWFPIHGVSISNQNHLVSGDNKGLAAYLLEHNRPGIHLFAQANEGDVSSNAQDSKSDANCDDFHCGDFRRLEQSAKKQYLAAKQLLSTAKTELHGPIDFRYQLIDMDTLNAPCGAALGYSFAAGTKDGVGSTWFKQGTLETSNIKSLMTSLFSNPSEAMKNCQAPKPILFAFQNDPLHWVAHRVPMQLVTIGSLAIVAVPGELSTMSGRRLRDTVRAALGSSYRFVVIMGLSNDYTGYVTTKEEYQVQRYEAASTLYGPNTLKIYQANFKWLAHALRTHKIVKYQKISVKLPNLLSLRTPVIADGVPPNTPWGSQVRAISKNYHSGDVVKVEFWSAHPRNNPDKSQPYFVIQRNNGGKWLTVADDNDPNTLFHWRRKWLDYSIVEIHWLIPKGIQPGMYRIVHRGYYKKILGRKSVAFSGTSRPLNIS